MAGEQWSAFGGSKRDDGVGAPSSWAYRMDPRSLRNAAWAMQALFCVRRQTRTGLGAVVLSPPPHGPEGRRAVAAVLRRSRATCLHRALVLQAWDAAHGNSRDVLIGVTSPAAGFAAHAWLDGDEDHPEYAELVRHPPPLVGFGAAPTASGIETAQP